MSLSIKIKRCAHGWLIIWWMGRNEYFLTGGYGGFIGILSKIEQIWAVCLKNTINADQQSSFVIKIYSELNNSPQQTANNFACNPINEVNFLAKHKRANFVSISVS